jgi:hypothetical protein
MSQHWWMDDDQLLAALGEALRSERGVPAEFIAMGKAAFAWYGIDAELAALTYDSVFEDAEAEVVGLRFEPASLRYLTFTSENLTLEIEVTDEAVLGQLVPPGPGRVEVRAADGTVVTAVVDQVGGFAVRPVPRGSFRLCCQVTNGANVLTGWLVLRDPSGE